MKLLSKRAGMTLVEVVVASGVLTLITISLVAMLIHSLRGWSSGTSKDTAVTKVTVALQRLATDVRDARSAQVVSGRLVVTFPATVVDGSTGERVYDLSANDPVTSSYYVLNGNLVRNRGGTISIIERGISAASFGASGGTVTITLTGADQEGTYSAARQVVSRVTLRNFRS